MDFIPPAQLDHESILSPDLKSLMTRANFEQIKKYFETESATRFCMMYLKENSRNFVSIDAIKIIYCEALYESLQNNDPEAIAQIHKMIRSHEFYFMVEKSVCGKVLDKCFERGTFHLVTNSCLMLDYIYESLDYLNLDLSDKYLFELHVFLLNHHIFFNSKKQWSTLMSHFISFSLDECKQILNLWFDIEIKIDSNYMFISAWTYISNVPRLNLLVEILLNCNLKPPSEFILHMILNRRTAILEMFYERNIDVISCDYNLDKESEKYYNILTKFGIDLETYLKFKSNELIFPKN